ncbi:recombinase family protein [Endozoicomonas sp. SESOKO2]|uniref:recombinase family protein n=1 Tax=Endozoicomonas sp. SESOKO2 TaxID=2828743 RepID=UPI0021474C71|nr:recombinase family protein [Endozoicomonas sp. SESOKO2]
MQYTTVDTTDQQANRLQDTGKGANVVSTGANVVSGANVGYIRVSSADQNTDRQLADLKLDRVFIDKCSGSTTDRPELKEMLRYVREGDTIHVHSIDRLARSLRDLGQIVDDLQNQGVGIHFHKNNLKFSSHSSPSDKLLLNMLGAVAEFEREIIRERQAEGIAKAKAKGVYKGRKPNIDKHERIRMLRHEEGMSLRKIAEAVGCSLSSVQRALAQS